MDTLTLNDMAIELGRKPSTLRRQVRLGRLTAGKGPNGEYVVTREELERYRRESLGKPGARNAAAGGHARAAKLTPERRREIGRMGADTQRRA